MMICLLFFIEIGVEGERGLFMAGERADFLVEIIGLAEGCWGV